MRKTLTIVALVLATGSLAACKPFWQKDPAPVPPAAVVEPMPIAETPTNATPVDPSKPAEQTASTDATKTTPAAKIEAPATPAAK